MRNEIRAKNCWAIFNNVRSTSGSAECWASNIGYSSVCRVCFLLCGYDSGMVVSKAFVWVGRFFDMWCSRCTQQSAFVSNGKRGEPNDADVYSILRPDTARQHKWKVYGARVRTVLGYWGKSFFYSSLHRNEWRHLGYCSACSWRQILAFGETCAENLIHVVRIQWNHT